MTGQPLVVMMMPSSGPKKAMNCTSDRNLPGVVNGWHCRYDLQTGKFDVPALFSGDNAKAVVPE